MSAVASSIRVSAPVKAGKAAAFNRGARVASVSDPVHPATRSPPCHRRHYPHRYPIPFADEPRWSPDAQVRPALPKARVSTVVRAREVGMKTDGTSATVRIAFPRPHRPIAPSSPGTLHHTSHRIVSPD